MWWANGLWDESKVYNIQTSRYGLSLDADDLRLRKLGPIDAPSVEAAVLTQDNAPIDVLPEVSIEIALEASDQRYAAQGAGPLTDDFQLIESGKYFQRRWLTNLAFASDAATGDAPPLNALRSGLEIAAWPDRVAFILRLVPTQIIENGLLEMTFAVPPTYSALSTHEGSAVFSNDDDHGFVLLKHAREEVLTCHPDTLKCTVRREIGGVWQASEAVQVGLIIYPTVAAEEVLADASVAETSPLDVRAAVHDVREAAAGFRHIVGLSDDVFHNTPLSNCRAMVEASREP